MRLVRSSIFETNSSSTHSLVLCMGDDITQWKEGKKFFLKNSDKFISTGEEFDDYCAKQVIYDKAGFKDAEDEGRYFIYKGIKYTEIKEAYTEKNLAEITQEEIKAWLEDDCVDPYDKPLTYDEYWNSIEEEGYYGFEQGMTTPSGEIVTAFGYYGNDY